MTAMEYTVKLAQFEGPLDLLLHLIQKAKIELKDIFVSEITAQYLSYMEELEDVDMDRASEFLNMAATLLYIKSRSLLPNKNDLGETDEGVDPEAELIERLRLYKIYKDAGEQLKQLAMEAQGIYFKLPEELFEENAEIIIEDADTQLIYRAFLSLLKREHSREMRPNEVKISRDMFSIRLQKKMILDRMSRTGKLSFFTLFSDGASPMEIAVTFVALLELCSVGSIKVKQDRALGDITLMAG